MSEARRGSRWLSRVRPACPSLPPRMLAVCAVLGTVAGVSLANSSAALAATGGDGYMGVFISEVYTHGSGDGPTNSQNDTLDLGDWIELHNTSSADVPLNGVTLSDNDNTHAYVIGTDGTTKGATVTIPAGGYMAFRTDANSNKKDSNFSLGDVDEARLYAPGAAVGSMPAADEFDWNHSPVHSWARNFDASGDVWQASGKTTPGMANDFTAGDDDISAVKINEVNMNGGPGAPAVGMTPAEPAGDWIELYNTSSATVNVAGAILSDGVDNHAYVIGTGPEATNTMMPGHGFLAIQVDNPDLDGNFGLGSSDSARLYPDSILDLYGNGTAPTVEPQPAPGSDAPTQDTTTWPNAMVFTWGRAPDGTGTFGPTTGPSANETNADAPAAPTGSDLSGIRLSEVKTTGDPNHGDWIELTNTNSALSSPVDLGNTILSDDNDGNIMRIKPGTMIDGGAAIAFMTDTDTDNPTITDPNATGSFGLGDVDSARLFTADSLNLGTGAGAATPVDSFSWSDHARTSYGRMPGENDASDQGDWAETSMPSFGVANTTVDFGSSMDFTTDPQSFIQINEIETTEVSTNPPPFDTNDGVELINTSPNPVDVANMVLSDNDDGDAITLDSSNTEVGNLCPNVPAGNTPHSMMGTTIMPGEFALVLVDSSSVTGNFGLGSDDAVRLYEAGSSTPGTSIPVDHDEWTDHPNGSYQRQDNGLGGWLNGAAGTQTPLEPNDCTSS